MNLALIRRAIAELIGTAFLVMAVVGSGIAAQRLFPDDDGLTLLANSVATGAALVALILALQPVSASFNPVVTAVERLMGAIDTATAVTLASAQIVGGITGTLLANVMFELDVVSIAGTERSGYGQWVGEAVATFGLVLLIFGTLRNERLPAVAVTVGAYITAAYWFTSSTSFANPAVTIARMFSDTFTGIEPTSVPMFLAMQVVGGLLAFAVVRFLYPAERPVDEGVTA